MKIKVLLTAILGICMVSCGSNESVSDSSEVVDNQKSVNTVQGLTPRALVNNNTFIDVDIEAYDKMVKDNFDVNNPASIGFARENYPEEWAMVQASRYRYEMTVTMVDGYLVSSAEKASDLNMSERTFNFWRNNMNNLNEQAKKCRAEGMTVDLTRRTKEQLEAMLDQ